MDATRRSLRTVAHWSDDGPREGAKRAGKLAPASWCIHRGRRDLECSDWRNLWNRRKSHPLGQQPSACNHRVRRARLHGAGELCSVCANSPSTAPDSWPLGQEPHSRYGLVHVGLRHRARIHHMVHILRRVDGCCTCSALRRSRSGHRHRSCLLEWAVALGCSRPADGRRCGSCSGDARLARLYSKSNAANPLTSAWSLRSSNHLRHARGTRTTHMTTHRRRATREVDLCSAKA